MSRSIYVISSLAGPTKLTTVIPVAISRDTAELLARWAKTNGISRSAAVRMLIEAGLVDLQHQPPASRARERSRDEALDLHSGRGQAKTETEMKPQREHAEELLRLIGEDHKRRHHMRVNLKKFQRDRTKFIFVPLEAPTLTVKRSTAV